MKESHAPVKIECKFNKDSWLVFYLSVIFICEV